MAHRQRLTEREQLKRLLAAESELHRAVLRSEWQRLASSGDLARGWKDAVPKWAPGTAWWTLGSAAAGLLLARRWKPLLRWAPAAWTLWRWWRRFGAK